MDYDSINQDTELGTLESVVEIGSCLEMNQENVGVMYMRKFSLYGNSRRTDARKKPD